MLFGPELGPSVWGMPVHASTTWIYLCHESRDQGEVQDQGECGREPMSRREASVSAACCHGPVPPGQRV